MKNCVYLISNGDLHKIGITDNFDRRMRQLQPDHIQACLNLDDDENFTAEDVERMLHSRFKVQRIPQTEYFRLSNRDILECCQIMKSFSEQADTPIEEFVVGGAEHMDAAVSMGKFEKEFERIHEQLEDAEATGNQALIDHVIDRFQDAKRRFAIFNK